MIITRINGKICVENEMDDVYEHIGTLHKCHVFIHSTSLWTAIFNHRRYLSINWYDPDVYEFKIQIYAYGRCSTIYPKIKNVGDRILMNYFINESSDGIARALKRRLAFICDSIMYELYVMKTDHEMTDFKTIIDMSGNICRKDLPDILLEEKDARILS